MVMLGPESTAVLQKFVIGSLKIKNTTPLTSSRASACRKVLIASFELVNGRSGLQRKPTLFTVSLQVKLC